jgi:hypothetical protein
MSQHQAPVRGLCRPTALLDGALIEAFNLLILLGQHIKENLDGASE